MFELIPFRLLPERAEIISRILRGVAETPTLFSEATCEERCFAQERLLPEMCPECLARMQTVSEVVGARDSKAWEVWDDSDVVGLILFTDVTPLDAVGHYVFFDSKLSDKTEVMEAAIQMMFEEVPRLTVQIPRSFVSLARHAQKRLGFGGPFQQRLKGGKTLHLEGVKRRAALRDGRLEDLLILGRLREDPQHTTSPPQPDV